MKQRTIYRLSFIPIFMVLEACARPDVVKEVAGLTSKQVGAMNVAALNELAFLQFQRNQIESENNDLQNLSKHYQFVVNSTIGDWTATNNQLNLRVLSSLKELDSQTRKEVASAINPSPEPQVSPIKGITQLEQVQSALTTLNNDQKMGAKELGAFAGDVFKEFEKIQDSEKQAKPTK